MDSRYLFFLLNSVYLHFIGSAAPGAPGGGASPSVVGAGAAAPQTLATALTLVPLGLTPIAVFPPYNTPRRIPAVSVIFSEDPNIRYFELNIRAQGGQKMAISP